jgi:hypothetical protein
LGATAASFAAVLIASRQGAVASMSITQKNNAATDFTDWAIQLIPVG